MPACRPGPPQTLPLTTTVYIAAKPLLCDHPEKRPTLGKGSLVKKDHFVTTSIVTKMNMYVEAGTIIEVTNYSHMI